MCSEHNHLHNHLSATFQTQFSNENHNKIECAFEPAFSLWHSRLVILLKANTHTNKNKQNQGLCDKDTAKNIDNFYRCLPVISSVLVFTQYFEILNQRETVKAG